MSNWHSKGLYVNLLGVLIQATLRSMKNFLWALKEVLVPNMSLLAPFLLVSLATWSVLRALSPNVSFGLFW